MYIVNDNDHTGINNRKADLFAGQYTVPTGTAHKNRYACKMCGYVYEGDELPENFICPVCKHGADQFEPVR